MNGSRKDAAVNTSLCATAVRHVLQRKSVEQSHEYDIANSYIPYNVRTSPVLHGGTRTEPKSVQNGKANRKYNLKKNPFLFMNCVG